MEAPKVIGKIDIPEPKPVEKCSCCGTKYRLLVNSDGLICEDCWYIKVQQEYDICSNCGGEHLTQHCHQGE